MALPVPLPVAMSAIKALVKFRGRVDTILAVKEASAPLPFALPPAPTDDLPHIDPMLGFFTGETGEFLLEVRGLREDFELVRADPLSADVFRRRKRLLKTYYDATEVTPERLGPNPESAAVSSGPSTEMRIAYYVVESHRLSRNPALTRILLATADTLLEFAGENAALFVSDPRTRTLIEAFLGEFAGKGDFDDDSVDRIFKKILGSTIVAVMDHPGELAEKPALKALFAALADARSEFGDNFAAGIISAEGFQQVVGAYLTHVAEDPSFITSDKLLSEALTAMLKEVGQNFPAIADDPGAITSVMEAGLVAAAADVAGVLAARVEDAPLLAAALSAVAGAIEEQRQQDPSFSALAQGKVIGAVYASVLETIAADPTIIGVSDGASSLAKQLVSGIAQALAEPELTELFTTETLQLIASESLEALAEHPEFLAENNEFAAKVLQAVFRTAAAAGRTGPKPEDLLEVVRAAIRAASENHALVGMDDHFVIVLASIGNTVANGDLRELLTPEGRKEVLLATLQAIAANPALWEEIDERELVQPLAEAIVAGLASDPSNLLTGPVLVGAVRKTLTGLARRGRVLVENGIAPDALRELLCFTLEAAKGELGRNMDAEDLPDLLGRVLSAFLEKPVDLAADGGQAAQSIFDEALIGLRAA